MVAGRPDAVPATSRAAVTSLKAEHRMAWLRPRPRPAGPRPITAEIPAVPVAPAYGVLFRTAPSGTRARSETPRPHLLRVTVWALAFLVAIGGAALIVEHYQPSWLQRDPTRRRASRSVGFQRPQHF